MVNDDVNDGKTKPVIVHIGSADNLATMREYISQLEDDLDHDFFLMENDPLRHSAFDFSRLPTFDDNFQRYDPSLEVGHDGKRLPRHMRNSGRDNMSGNRINSNKNKKRKKRKRRHG